MVRKDMTVEDFITSSPTPAPILTDPNSDSNSDSDSDSDSDSNSDPNLLTDSTSDIGTDGTSGSKLNYEKIIEETTRSNRIIYSNFTNKECPVQSVCVSDFHISTLWGPDIEKDFDCQKKPKPEKLNPPLFPCLAEIAKPARDTMGYAQADPKTKEISGLGVS